MIVPTDRPLVDVIACLAKEGFEEGYLVPTVKVLEKSILDADDKLRIYLKSKKLHDYRFTTRVKWANYNGQFPPNLGNV